MPTNQFDSNRIDPEAYSHVNRYVDNFAKIAHVRTELICGDRDLAPAPLVSVIIPTYQRGELFRQALESVLQQEDPGFSWEILVVDNTPGDMPPALEIIRQLGDSRVLYYRNSVNIGPGYNWNRGVELARGKWVCFLHDDDLLYPDALRNIGRLLNRAVRYKKPLGYIRGRRTILNAGEDPRQKKRVDRAWTVELTQLGSLITYYSRTGMPTYGTTVLKEAYCRAGGINYDFGPSADAVLGYQIMEEYTVLLSDRALGYYRWSVNETLRADTLKQLVRADDLFARYRCSRSPGARLWGRLFDNVQYNLNAERKTRTGRENGMEICKADLMDGNRRPDHRLVRLVYLCVLGCYFCGINLRGIAHLVFNRNIG